MKKSFANHSLSLLLGAGLLLPVAVLAHGTQEHKKSASNAQPVFEQTDWGIADKGAEHHANLNASNLSNLQVFKSPTCGCCTSWIKHLEHSAFFVNYENVIDTAQVKNRYGIPQKYRSCHTAVSADGYAFEGHVPAKFIRQFLTEKPAGAIGLAVPAMPIGSPGMEVGSNFTPYQVVLLMKDGSSRVYADIQDYKTQF